LQQVIYYMLMNIGIDVNSSKVVVGWQPFLDLYCIFEDGKMEKQHLIKFWQKFFD